MKQRHMDDDFGPMFMWFGMALFFMFAAPILLFSVWQWVGPIGMLVSFALAFACIFRGMVVGWQETWKPK